jgi:undecaprenyl diphosphate synthase
MLITDPKYLPKHVAIIMDGNGRWAKLKAMNRVRGHEEGAESVREVVRTSRELGIPWLTLYAFSEENWNRPKYEIGALMKLLKRFLQSEEKELLEKGIRFQAIGRVDKLSQPLQGAIKGLMEKTKANREMTLTLALSYGSKQEIIEAVKRIGGKIETGEITASMVSEELLSDHLYTVGMPEPDLLIRTSGEYRVSNFLLFQIAYTEFYFTSTYWPDFRKKDYTLALEEYQKRARRFGSTEA